MAESTHHTDPPPYEAGLQRARWQTADLRGANLKGARLHRASFEHADLREAHPGDTRLSGAEGLSTG